MKNYYDVLEGSQEASRDVIKATYQAKAKQPWSNEKHQLDEESQDNQVIRQLSEISRISIYVPLLLVVLITVLVSELV